MKITARSSRKRLCQEELVTNQSFLVDTMLLPCMFVFILVEYSATEENIAFGAHCCASSAESSNFGCGKAVDGVALDYPDFNTWASYYQGVGAWLILQFADIYLIDRIKVMNRWFDTEENKDVELLFGDGSTQNVTLPYLGTGGYVWNDFALVPVISRWVKITITAVYIEGGNNGWTEVEIFGDQSYRVFRYPDTGMVNVDILDKHLGQLECANVCVRDPTCLAASVDIRTGQCRQICDACLLAELESNGSFVLWAVDRGL